jgi:serine/threonine protein kinase
MHDVGISHRDLKGENIIAREYGNMRFEFRIVDFDGVRCRAVSERTRVKNLARLARAVAVEISLTSADRFRLVKNYLADGESSRCRKMYPDLLKFIRKYFRRYSR